MCEREREELLSPNSHSHSHFHSDCERRTETPMVKKREQLIESKRVRVQGSWRSRYATVRCWNTYGCMRISIVRPDYMHCYRSQDSSLLFIFLLPSLHPVYSFVFVYCVKYLQFMMSSAVCISHSIRAHNQSLSLTFSLSLSLSLSVRLCYVIDVIIFLTESEHRVSMKVHCKRRHSAIKWIFKNMSFRWKKTTSYIMSSLVQCGICVMLFFEYSTYELLINILLCFMRGSSISCNVSPQSYLMSVCLSVCLSVCRCFISLCLLLSPSLSSSLVVCFVLLCFVVFCG